MGQAGDDSFTNLVVTTPGCGPRTSLNDLAYERPVGFALRRVAVLNPQRGRLDEAELAQVATELGQPLKQAMAHY